LEAGSAFRVPTFRNYTLVNPQVGSPRDLGVRQIISIGLFQTRKTNLPHKNSSSTTIIFVNNACIVSMIINIHVHFQSLRGKSTLQ
jgi:hypothetical protein